MEAQASSHGVTLLGALLVEFKRALTKRENLAVSLVLLPLTGVKLLTANSAHETVAGAVLFVATGGLLLWFIGRRDLGVRFFAWVARPRR